MLPPSLSHELETAIADLLEEVRTWYGTGGMASMSPTTQARYEAGERVLARLRRVNRFWPDDEPDA